MSFKVAPETLTGYARQVDRAGQDVVEIKS
jgi:hypothetical protein